MRELRRKRKEARLGAMGIMTLDSPTAIITPVKPPKKPRREAQVIQIIGGPDEFTEEPAEPDPAGPNSPSTVSFKDNDEEKRKQHPANHEEPPSFPTVAKEINDILNALDVGHQLDVAMKCLEYLRSIFPVEDTVGYETES